MVAIVSGNGIGLMNTSGKVLGQSGLFGNATTGSSKEGTYVNVANGNLTLQDQDDYIAASGIDLALTRTYNSQGGTTDGIGAQWKLGVRKQVILNGGVAFAANTTLTRIDGDGTLQTYTLNSARTAYTSTDGAGATQSIVKDSNNNWIWRDDRSDLLGMQESYDSTTNCIMSVSDAVGVRLSYLYDAGGQLAQITDATGDITTFAFQNGLLAQISTRTSATNTFTRTSYSYDTLGRLRAAIIDLTPENSSDNASYTTMYAYDGDSNRIANLTQSDGTSLNFTYVSSGGAMKIATVSQTMAGVVRTTSYDYSVASQTSVKDPIGNISVYGYDAKGQLTKVTEAPVAGVSAVTSFAYDAFGNVLGVTTPGGTTTAVYDGNGNQTKVTDALGNTITRTFDTVANVPLTETVTSSAGAAATTRYVYDASHRLRFIISGEGRLTEYRYNANGDRTDAITYAALPSATTLSEAQLKTWAASNIAGASVTEYAYDGRGLIAAKVTYATIDSSGNRLNGAVTLYYYDQAGQLLSQSDPDRNLTRFTYDGLGRLLTTTDAGGNVTTNAYDDAHNTLRTTLANGTVTTEVFDAAGEILSKSIVAADGTSLGVTRYTYDADGRLCMSVDPMGIRTFAFYDADGRRAADVDGDGTLTEYFYDKADNLTRSTRYASRINTAALVDTAGNYLALALDTVRPGINTADRSTWNIYDKLGRLTDSVDGEGYLTHLDYDAFGHVVQNKQFANAIGLTALNALTTTNQPTSFTAPVLSQSDDRITRSIYDKDGNLVGTLDPEGYLSERRYDAAGRLAESIQYAAVISITGTTLTMAQVRPITSNVADVHTRYIYDSSNRLVGTVDSKGYLSENVYSASGDLTTTVLYSTAITTTFADSARIDNLRPLSSTNDKRTNYLYDALGRIATTTDANGVTATYTYDKLGNLSAKTLQRTADMVSSVQYRYDGSGNVIAELPPLGGAALATTTDSVTVWSKYATTYTYDADGRRTGTKDPNGNQTLYFYDNDGRLAYTIDALGDVAQTTYNAFGQISQTVRYANRVSTGVLKNLNGGAATSAIAAISALPSPADTITTYAYDRNGNLTDEVDALKFDTVRKYDAFGEVTAVGQPGIANSVTPDLSVDGYSRIFYDKDGRIAETLTGTGSFTAYQYDSNDHVTDKITYAKLISVASITTITKDAATKLVVADPVHDAHQRYIYDTRGLVVSTFTAVSYNPTYTYDANGTAIGAQQWSIATNTYDAYGNVESHTSYANLVYRLDGNYPTSATTVAASNTDQIVRYYYDGLNRLTATATAQRVGTNGRDWSVSTREYDGAGNVVTQTNFSNLLSLPAPTSADIASFTNSNGTTTDKVTRYAYDAGNRLIASAVAQGVQNGVLNWALTSYSYDNADNLLSETQLAIMLASGANSASTTQADWRAWLTTGTSGTSNLDRTTQFGYDALNRQAVTIDAVGSVSSRVFDAKGNIVKTVDYAKPRTNTGLVTSGDAPVPVDADRVTRTIYDLDGRPAFTVDDLGGVTEYRYDARSNVVKTIAYATAINPATLSDTTIAADLKPVSSSNDRIERRVYDQSGQLRYVVDAAGYVTETQYDGAGRVSKLVDWDFAPTVAEGASTAIWTTALAAKTGRTKTYTYDADGKLLTLTDFDGKIESYTYDGVDNQLTFKNKALNTWTYQYDAAGHIIQETSPPVDMYPDAVYVGGVWTNTYKVTNASVLTKITYDAFGNVTTRTEAAGTAQERITQYVYDDVGRQVKTVLPSVPVYNGGTDASQLVSTRFEVDSGALTVEVTYNAFGNAIASKDVGGNISEKAYDALSRVAYERDAMGYVTEYQRDSFGNVTKLIRHVATYTGSMALSVAALKQAIATDVSQDRTIVYTYDALGRQTKSVEMMGYVYDANTSQSTILAARTVVTEYDGYDEVIGNSVYGTDANGAKITSASTVRYYYDVRGNKIAELAVMREAVGNQPATGYLTTYTYDAADNLTSKTEYANATSLFGDVRDKTTPPSIPAVSAKDRTTAYTYDALKRVLIETHIDTTAVDGSTGKSAAVATAVTTYTYDAVGNQLTVTDALGGVVSTRYDALGRVTAVKKSQPTATTDITTAASPLTEFKLDVFGNTVLRIDYALGAANATAGNFVALSTTDANNRMTATTYDKAGHATQVVHGVETGGQTASTLTYTFTSYDAFGRTAKQWSTYTDSLTGVLRNTYTITTYDALGRVASVTTPANVDNVSTADATGKTLDRNGLLIDRNVQDVTVTNNYDAFGELTQRNMKDADGNLSVLDQTSYDQAGRAWRSDSGGGVVKVTLFDVQGDATSVIRSSGTASANPLASLPSVASVFSLNNMLRTDTRYDLLGHATAITTVTDIGVLRHDAQTGSWTEVENDFKQDDLLIVSRPEDGIKTITVQYRLKGANDWIMASADRVDTVQGYGTFSTAGLPSGSYEFQVVSQGAGEAAYLSASGSVDVTSTSTTDKDIGIIRLFAVLFKRAPTTAEINQAIARMNNGASLIQLAQDMLDSAEGKAYLNGTAANIVAKIFADAFARTGANGDATYATDLASWSTRFQQIDSVAGDSRGQAIVDLIDQTLAFAGTNTYLAGARTRLVNRVAVESSYLIDSRGSDATTAARLFAAADTASVNSTSIDSVKTDAVNSAFQESLRQQISQLYVILLGRAPDPASMAYWYGYSLQTGSVTIDQVAQWTLDSAEATSDRSLYPTANLTPAQYTEQLVTHAYQNMLGRVPSSTELSAWLGALNGTNGAPPISKGQFVLQLADSVSSYKGADPARLQEKAQFNNRVAVAYAISGLRDINGNPLPVDGAATRLIINAVGADTSTTAAAVTAVNALSVGANFASTVSSASAALISSTQIESTRYQMARLYLAVFNRAPDTLGLAFAMNPPPTTEAAWIAFANSLLNSNEAMRDGTLVSVKNLNGTLVPRSNSEFVQCVYEQALGQRPLQPTVGMIAEMSALVQRLNNGESRGRVLLSALNGILGYSGLAPSEQALKDRFDNRAAVGVAVALDIGFTTIQVARDTVAMVTATDIQSALNYAYTKNQSSIAASLGVYGSSASLSASALDGQTNALSAQLVAQAGVQSATNALNNVANGSGLLTLVQVYVGLVGRTPDVPGLKFYFDAISRGTVEQNVGAIYASSEISATNGRFPPTDSNELFVAKVYASIFKLSLENPPAASGWPNGADWVQQLNAGTSRAQVWSSILTSVISYTNNQPDAAATQFLQYKQAFLQNVNTALGTLNYAAQNEIAPIQQADDSMHAQLAQLLATVNTTASARDAALSTAASQLSQANGAGDGLADYRLKLTLLYATVLQRAQAPTFVELNYWSDRNVSLADVAQSMVTTSEGAPTYAGLDNTAFVKLLYQRILHRDVTDTASINYYVNELTTGYSRGFVAVDILNNYLKYSDNTASFLTDKASFDGLIDKMLSDESTAASTSKNSAYNAWYSALLASNQAQTDYNTAVSTRDNALATKNAAVSSAVDAHTIKTYAGNQQSVTYIYMGLRGYTDIGGVAFWAKGYYPDDLITSLMPSGGTSTSFVSSLYNTVHGRTGTTAEMSYWVNLLDTGGDTRLNVAKNILYSAEATSRLTPLTTAAMNADNNVVNSRIAAETTATTNYNTAVTAANNKYASLQTLLATTASNKSAYDKANNVAASAVALASAHTYVATADTKYATAAAALSGYNAYKPTVDAEDVVLNAAKPYVNAEFAALMVASNSWSAATAALNVAAAVAKDGTLTATALQVRQVAQLYTTLVGSAPTLSAMNYWTAKLAAGISLVDVIAGIMNGPEAVAANLYPSGLSDTAFIVQLFRLAVGRDVSNEPISLQYWSNQLTGQNAGNRVQLAANFINSLVKTGNSDTLGFDRRVSQVLASIATAASTLSASTDAAPSNISLSDYGSAYAALVGDAAGRAAVAANPQAGNVTRAAGLYIAIMDRSPDAAGLVYWANAMSNVADGVIAQSMLASTEAMALYPASMSMASFASIVSGRILGRVPTAAELASYASMTRGQVVAAILNVAASPGTSMAQQDSALLFNGKVNAALAALQPDIAQYVDRSAAALNLAKLAQAANPVDKHMEAVPLGVNTQTQHGAIATPVATYTFDRWGNILSMTDPRDPNWITTYTYNTNNELLSTTTPFALTNGVVTDTSVTATSYDKLGRVVTTTDGRGFVDMLKYDSNGNVVSDVHADGGVVASTYDLFGERLSVTQPGTGGVAGVKTLYAYDHFGNLSSITTGASIAVYQTNHVTDGTPDFTVDASTSRQLAETYYYDELGRRVKTVNAAGEISSKRYDGSGNVIAETDAMGNTSRSSYDALGHLIARLDAIGTHLQTWNYDSQGRLTSQSNYTKLAGLAFSPAYAIKYTYDDAGRLVHQTASQGQDITYTYVGEQVRTIDDKGTGQLTSYTYDRAGNRIREKTVFSAANSATLPRIQNNTSTYDLQNRLSSVKDDVYTLTYSYDKNGNRTDTRTAYDANPFDAYNTYDSMNRQLIVNGVLAADGKTVIIGKTGHQLTYDLAGNRLTDTYAGTKLTYAGTTWTATANSTTTETYTYDTVGRLATITRDSMRIDTRYYDAAGRVLKSGMIPTTVTIGTASSFNKAAIAAGLTTEFRTYAYDTDGHVIRQVTRDASTSSLKGDVYLVFDSSNSNAGYDADGNLLGYTALDSNRNKSFYNLTYSFLNGAKETSTTVTNKDGKQNVTSSEYDQNLNRYQIKENNVLRTSLWFDANGQVVQKVDAGKQSFSLIVDGQVLGIETQTADNVLGTTYSSLSADTLQTTESYYTVQSATEDLQTIATALWGDKNLWYLIGDANGLTLQDPLTVGQTLRIPERATVVHNNADTFKPYNASAAIGDTTPLPVPSKSDGGCGTVGKVISIAIAVAVTVALSGAGSMLASTVSGLIGNATAAQAVTGAIAAGIGSAASQAFNVATGMQNGFSWSSVATAAISGGVTAGVTSAINNVDALSSLKIDGWQGAAARATISNTLSQGIGIATGLQSSFNWRSVAAAGAAAAAGSAVDNGSKTGIAGFTNGLTTGLVAGATAAVLRGGKITVTQVATDAFGNALANSLARQQQLAAMDAQVDDVMRDVLSNGERFVANNSDGRPISLGDKVHAEDMARIMAEARDEQYSRGADGALRVEIAGVNQPATNNDDLIEAVGGLAIEMPLAIMSGIAGAIVSPLYGVYADIASGKFGTSDGAQIGELAASQLAERIAFKPQTATAQYVLGKAADFVSYSGIQGLGFSELSALRSAASTGPLVTSAMNEVKFIGSGSGFKNPSLQIGALNPSGRKVASLGSITDAGANSTAVDAAANTVRAGSSRPAWLARLDAGNDFNAARSSAYPYNEVYIDSPKGSGYTRLDSYDPVAGEIVSRKFTQLSSVQEQTAFNYINELPAKYPVNGKIANVPTSGSLAGQPLLGQHILEVPVQTNPIPQSVLDAANRAGVLIRDVNGHVH